MKNVTLDYSFQSARQFQMRYGWQERSVLFCNEKKNPNLNLKDNQNQKPTPKQKEQLFLNGVWVSDKKIYINGSPPIALETSTSI